MWRLDRDRGALAPPGMGDGSMSRRGARLGRNRWHAVRVARHRGHYGFRLRLRKGRGVQVDTFKTKMNAAFTLWHTYVKILQGLRVEDFNPGKSKQSTIKPTELDRAR